MADSGPYAQGQDELQGRLNKIYREHHIIARLSQKWLQRADAFASHVSSVSNAGHFVEPFIGGFATLDRIFRILYKAHVVLSEEENFDDLELPGVAPGDGTYPFQHSGAEAPLQDTNGSCLSSTPLSWNMASVASLPISEEAPIPHSTDSDVWPVPPQNEPAIRPLTAPPVTKWPTGQTQTTQKSSVAAGTSTAPVSPIAAAARQMVLPSGRTGLAAESCSEHPTPTDGEFEADQLPATATPRDAGASSSLPPARPIAPRTCPKADGHSSALLLCERTTATRVGGSVERPVSSTCGHLDIPSANLVDLGVVHKVFIGSYSTPSEFWLQLESSGEVLETMTNSLSELCNATGPQAGFEAREGMSCAARYTVDNLWYRARILERKSDRVKVFYVDYGNCELVKLCDLRPLDKSHTLLPAQALHCGIQSVSCVASRGMWPSAAKRRFHKMLTDAGQLEARFQWQDHLTGCYVVDMLGRLAGGQATVNLSREFLSQYVKAMTPNKAPQAASLSAGTAPATKAPVVTSPAAAHSNFGRPVRIPPAILPDEDTIPVVTTVVFSPTEFYVIPQMDGLGIEKLEDMQGQLADSALASSPPTVDEVTEGTFWICLCDSDQKWCRVRVLEDAKKDYDQRVLVLFVDSGDRCMVAVSDLRPLPAHLAELPARAHRMSLAFLAPRGGEGDGWDQQATRMFIENTGLHNTVLIAEKRGQRQLGFETVTDVMLWNTTCKPELSLNFLLLEHKWAVFTPETREESKNKE